MEKVIAFDIETIADRSVISDLSPLDVKIGNLKDQAKIAAKKKAAEDERIKKLGLDPFTNLICAFGWCDGNDSGCILLKNETQEAEKLLLEDIWELLHGYDHFVSFNGAEFDVKIINLHSLFQKVRPSVHIDTRKYQIRNHTDVRAVLTGWDKFAPGKLDFFLKRCLGRSKPEDIDGSMVQDFWDLGMTEEIGQYCEGDARDTWDLYQYVKEYWPL